MSDTVTLPVSPETFWGLVTLAAVLLAMIAIFGLLSGVKDDAEETPFIRLRARLGMAGLPQGVFALGMILWGAIFAALILGLIWTIISAAFHAPARTQEAQTALRFVLISLTALTATLGAVVAFPVTLIRIALTRKQTETAEEALFNDKVNAAAGGLAARRQVTRVVGRGAKMQVLTEWEDDLVTRASAIDRLEGLAKERPDTAARVARMLSIYVRELSREYPAKEPPEGASTQELREWAAKLTPIRPDMEKAAQSLGRLQRIDGHDIATGDIDLRHANLQGFDLGSLNFENVLFESAEMQGAILRDAEMQGANLRGAEMQGAILWGAQLQEAYLVEAQLQGADLRGAKKQGADLMDAKMQGAILWDAEMQGAYLWSAEMQGTHLSGTQMQGAYIWGAKLQGADLSSVQMQGAYLDSARMNESTDLNSAILLGAALRNVNHKTIAQMKAVWGDIFADGTVQLPEGEQRPDHWVDEILNQEDFHTQWHAWQETLPDFDSSWRRG
ncbi:pentapeptide repeat-containing protein [Nioella sp.]|uniref:pentapeptide repeat-containing protein n=1 Tax=Nioella sp. TaxID=1912091 RepID=UPI003A83A9E4